MKIEFNPDKPEEAGVKSTITWENPQLHKALREVFGESPRETLYRIDVGRYNLTAYFRTRT